MSFSFLYLQTKNNAKFPILFFSFRIHRSEHLVFVYIEIGQIQNELTTICATNGARGPINNNLFQNRRNRRKGNEFRWKHAHQMEIHQFSKTKNAIQIMNIWSHIDSNHHIEKEYRHIQCRIVCAILNSFTNHIACSKEMYLELLQNVKYEAEKFQYDSVDCKLRWAYVTT